MQILDNGDTVRIEYIDYDLGFTTFFDITKDMVKDITEHIEFYPPGVRYYDQINKKSQNWHTEIVHVEPPRNKNCIFFDICVRELKDGVPHMHYSYYIMKKEKELKEVVYFVDNKR